MQAELKTANQALQTPLWEVRLFNVRTADYAQKQKRGCLESNIWAASFFYLILFDRLICVG